MKIKRLLASFLIGATILGTGAVSFAAQIHTEACNGRVYTQIKKAQCGCPNECIKIYYCSVCGQIGADTTVCPK